MDAPTSLTSSSSSSSSSSGSSINRKNKGSKSSRDNDRKSENDKNATDNVKQESLQLADPSGSEGIGEDNAAATGINESTNTESTAVGEKVDEDEALKKEQEEKLKIEFEEFKKQKQLEEEDKEIDKENKKRLSGYYCNDLIVALAFVAYIILMMVFAMMYGTNAVKFDQTIFSNSTTSLFLDVYLLSSAAVLPSLIWMALMYCASTFFIQFALVFLLALSVAAAAGLTIQFQAEGYQNYWWPAIVFGVFALMVLIYIVLIQKNVKFASANLRVAVAACFSKWGLFFGALITIIGQFIALVGIFYGTYAIAYQFNITGAAYYALWFASALGMFWVYQTSRNVIAIATASTIYAWWKYPGKTDVTYKSYLRATTSNLGAAALGSMFVSLIETLNMFAVTTASCCEAKDNKCAACMYTCMSSCLTCCGYLMKVFNRFAFVFVGIDQIGYIRSGKKVINFLIERGCLAIINDNLIENVLWMASLITGGIIAVLGYFIANDQSESYEFTVAISFLGFFLGYTISQIVFAVISGGTAAVCICFIEMPGDLQKYNEPLYKSLEKVWKDEFPDVFKEESEPLNP